MPNIYSDTNASKRIIAYLKTLPPFLPIFEASPNIENVLTSIITEEREKVDNVIRTSESDELATQILGDIEISSQLKEKLKIKLSNKLIQERIKNGQATDQAMGSRQEQFKARLQAIQSANFRLPTIPTINP